MIRALHRAGLSSPVSLAVAVPAFLLMAIAVGCGADSSDPTPEPAPLPSLTAAPEEQGGLAGPDPLSLPKSPAPLGLGSVELPDDAESILTLFRQMPDELTGRQRAPQQDQTGPGRYTAAYEQLPENGCSSVRIQVQDLSTGDFFPADWTADMLVAWWTLATDWEVDDVGRDGDLFWVRWNTTCSSAPTPQTYPVSSLTWGQAGSRWVFSATATDFDGVAALVAAFLSAATP